MKFTQVTPKTYIKLRILATIIDYAVIGIFYVVYLYVFDQSTQPGPMRVDGIMVLPIPIVWVIHFVLLEIDKRYARP